MAAAMLVLIVALAAGQGSAQFSAPPPGLIRLGNQPVSPPGLVRLGPPGAVAPAAVPAFPSFVNPPVQFVPAPAIIPAPAFIPTTSFVEATPQVIFEEAASPAPSQPPALAPNPPPAPAPTPISPPPPPTPAPALTRAPAENGKKKEENEGRNEGQQGSSSPGGPSKDMDVVDVTLDPVASGSGCSDVIAVASEIPNLGTLVKAVKAAGVLNKLKGPDKVFTVLAPSDEAFGATLRVIDVTEEQFLSSPALLKRVLALHIIPGKALRSSDLSDGASYDSLSGKPVTFSVVDHIDEVSVKVPSGVEAEVILKNLEACSAIVHVIGTVLLPEPPQNMETNGNKNSSDSEEATKGEPFKPSDGKEKDRKVEALAPVSNGGGGCAGAFDPLKSRSDSGTYLELVEEIGFLDQVGSMGTVLVPTDLAFEKLLGDVQLTKEDLLSEKSRGLVQSLLRFHFVSGKVLKAADMTSGQSFVTLLGPDKTFEVQKAGEIIATAGSTGTLTTTDLDSCIGVVHVIDTVLIPDS